MKSGARLGATHVIHVFFGSGAGTRLPRTIEALTDFAPHVSVGDNDVVYDLGRFYPLERYALMCPGLWRCFVIPVDATAGLLQGLPRPTGRWPIDVLLRRDCVGIVTRALRRAGVRVPWLCFTPAHLYDFLRGEGFDEHHFERCEDGTGGA